MSSRDLANLKQGLVAAWIPSLGSTGYRLVDRVGSNHGVLTNMDAGDWVVSGGNLALDFDGSDDYVNIVLTRAQPLSISCFYRFSSSSPSVPSYLFDGSDASNRCAIGLGLDGQGLPHLQIFAGTVLAPSPAITVDQQWHSLVAVFNGLASQVYVDGILRATGNAGTQGLTGLILASRFSVSNFGLCQLDDIRIYNRILTEPEIRLLASKRGIGLQPRPKQFTYYQFPSGSKRRRLLTGMP